MSSTHKHVGLGAVLIAVVLFAGPAQAIYIWNFDNPLEESQSIADIIITHGGGFQVGDKLFDNFYISTSATPGVSAPDFYSIKLSGTQSSGEFGLLFNDIWSVLPGQQLDTFIQFQVTATDENLLIHDNTLAIVGFGNSTFNSTTLGLLAVDETVYLNKFYGLGGNATQLPIVQKHVEISPTLTVLSDHKIFGDANGNGEIDETEDELALRSVWIVKDIGLNGGGAEGSGSVRLSGVIQTFSQIPEPASVTLFGLGTATLLWRRRHS